MWASDSYSGFSQQGFSQQGFSQQGFSQQGFSQQGFSQQGFSQQGFSQQGFNVMGPPLLGMDRLRGLAANTELRWVEYAFVQTATNLQVMQPVPTAPTVSYTVYSTLPSGIQLRSGPGGTETGPGTFIYVPNGSGGAKDLRGTFWNLVTADATGTGAIGLYISDWSKDPNTNLSKYPANDDVYLYTVYYRQPATQQWVSLCPVDGNTGKPTAMAMPADGADWNSAKFTFACTASGVASKCARKWGYKPWLPDDKLPVENVWTGTGFEPRKIPLKPFYDACIISARADYCQDGQSYTQNGTLVDLFDTLDGFTSINATAGMAFTPGSTLPMMHEEFQISALDLSTYATTKKPFYVLDGLDSTELMSISPEDQAALAKVRRSGMQSSRYADLDPGRSCLAAPFVDRCDPHEPYACYRDVNMAANPYGAFLAVNSPRHCDHDEATPGAPLDPLCNLCVNRVCSVDPSCCADPGATMYPGSLSWDSRCSDIRSKVCRGSQSTTLWPLGVVAPVAGSSPVTFLRGAIGSFEGIVTDASGNRFAEGWACDPDYPGASSWVQVSVAASTTSLGYLGAPSAVLGSAPANLPLRADWRDTVARECGEAGRHGFRFQLPANSDGREVYVYGFDLNTQAAAPFSLLRGGKKLVPTTTALAAPKSVIWSGWLEPTATGAHVFSVDATTSDKYRVWINGTYVAGNYPDPNPSRAGAFVQPAITPSLSLTKGVRYPVRVEYLVSSKLVLKWDPPDAGVGVVTIPTTALYPAAATAGNGLRGTYYSGSFTGTPSGTLTWGAVDYVWTNTPCTIVPPATTCAGGPPAPGFKLSNSFAARFEGQVMAPVSGTYQFTADTDEAVSIWVDGQLVTDLTRRPPDAGNKATCGERDICHTGAAISKTCDQGYFCSAQICNLDPACCSITWDAQCVQEVSTICHVDCRQTAPIGIQLRAGAKYDIKVEVQHTGASGANGAKVRLYWSLDGGTRDKLPQHYLFGEVAAAAPGKGTGLNVAYFSNTTDAFTGEYLARVDGQLNFAVATRPTVAIPLASDAVCGVTGVAACTEPATEVTGAPALVQPALGSRNQGTTVQVKVTGAIPGAAITLVDSYTDPSTLQLKQVTYSGGTADASGTVSPALTNMVKADHSMTVAQTVSGKTISKASAPVTFSVIDVIDTSLPPAPAVTIPVGGLVATNGSVAITVASTAPSVKVTIKQGTTTVGTTTGTPTGGVWNGTIVLPSPGIYTLVIEHTLNGKLVSTTVTAKYALPPLKSVTAPAATTPEPIVDSGPVLVKGTAAAAVTGSTMVVADGDGRYFQEISPNPFTFNVTTGAFSANLTLDPGRHVLKIFQRVNGMDGDAVIRGVSVRPASGAISIDVAAPAEGAVFKRPVDDTNLDVVEVPLSGTGPARTALAYGAAIYQKTTKLGEVTLAKDGKWAAKVMVSGSGKQNLFVRLLASSLSGGGSAESLDGTTTTTSRNVVIQPPPPVISLNPPVTQTATTLTFSGTGVALATITAYIDGVKWAPAPPTTLPVVTVGSTGKYTATSFPLPQGLHVLTVTQALDGAESAPSRQILLRIGDITAPTLDVLTPNVSVTTTDVSGAKAVDLLTLGGVTAKDNGVAVTPVCVPANKTDFPIGSTQVTCSVQDAAGNGKTRTLMVNVVLKVPPALNGSDVTVEAKGPQGAAVAYQVSATGFIADCAPAGSAEIIPCTAWSPVYTGLGFAPYTVTADRLDGSLYATDYQAGNTDPGKLYRSADQGASWTRVAVPISLQSKLAVAPGAATLGVASVLYIPSPTGLQALTLPPAATPKPTLVLPGVAVRGVSVDPSNRSHVLAWNMGDGAPVSLFETNDAGKTWTYAADGLPLESAADLSDPHITNIAFDSFHAGRIYAQVAPKIRRYDAGPERVYRRIGKGGWERLAIPPIPPRYSRGDEAALGVSPSRGTREYPTVYAAGLQSLDGGDTWLTVPSMDFGINAIAFDDNGTGRVYAIDNGRFMVSSNNGDTFSEPNDDVAMGVSALVQDPSSSRGDTIYATLREGGMRKTTTAGNGWSVVNAPGASGLRNVVDMATDPVDPRTAYLLAVSGFYKTTDGGSSWIQRTAGIEPGNRQAAPYKTVITIDPFDNRMIYLSGNVPQGMPAFVSTDSGGDQGLPWAWSTMGSMLAADPSAKVFFSTNDTGSIGTDGMRIVGRRDTPNSFAFYALQGVAGASSSLHAHALQVFPDAARTVALSYYTSATTGGTVLWSARDAQVTPASATVLQTLTGAPVKPIYDNSDGADSLYVSGDALGSTPNQLYKSPLATVAWQKVGGGQLGIDFRRLAIDPNGGGQIMYAVGADDGLWISQNGGLTWTEDRTAPSFISNVWASPLDGALFAAVSDTQSTELGRQTQAYLPDLGDTGMTEQTLWKRSLSTTPPPGANIVQGTLRVTCKAVLAGVTRSVRSGSVFPVATTQVNCTATDVFGNTLTKTINIKVQDTTPPLMTVPAPITVTTTSTDPNVTVPVSYTVTAVDLVSGSLTPTCTTSPVTTGNNFKLGVTSVTCTATDAAGNKGTASFTVTVLKSGTTIPAPILNVPANLSVEATLLDTATGNPAAKPNPAVTATTSAGGALTPTCTPVLTSNFLLGTTPVTCSATDSGYTVTKSFTVTVTDKTLPVFASTPTITVPRQGPQGAIVTFNVTAKDLGVAVPVTCVPSGVAPGSLFATGTTVVTCKATDKVGNTATRRFNVVVTETDVNPPVLTAPPVVVAEATDSLGGRAFFTVSATDAESGARPVDCAPTSGSWFPMDESLVTCQTADAAGHIVRASFPVRIVDTTAPEITVPATIRAEASVAGGLTVPFAVSAYDLVNGKLTPTCTRPNGVGVGQPVTTGALFPVGDTVVTCAATDGKGNTSSKGFHVIVNDTQGPVITVPATTTVDAGADGTKVVNYTVTAVDRGVSVPVTCTPASGSRFLFGTTNVACVAYDGRGNMSKKGFNVVVALPDTVAPTFTTFPADLTAFATSASGAAVTYTVVATDAIDGARPVTCTKASGATFAPNKTTVTCTASDTRGNTVSRSFVVWVQFNTTQTSGLTFFAPPAANGSTIYKWGREAEISIAMQGVSAPATNVLVKAQVATIAADGTVGTFSDAFTITGTNGQMTYNSGTGRYTSVLTTGNLTPDLKTRFRADLGDGVTREVDFYTSSSSVMVEPATVFMGQVRVNSTGTVSGLSVKNVDTVPVPVSVSVAAIVGSNSEWTIPVNDCPATLAAGASCLVNVRLIPQSTGTKQGRLTAATPSSGSFSAVLNGTGI
jgi:hypothetical protein